jgi:hypothetical protein
VLHSRLPSRTLVLPLEAVVDAETQPGGKFERQAVITTNDGRGFYTPPGPERALRPMVEAIKTRVQTR